MKTPKRSARMWFAAELSPELNGVWSLAPSRGCRRVVVSIPADQNEWIVESSMREPSAKLCANLGDHLLCAGPGADEQAVVEVVGITQGDWNERLSVVFKAGRIDSKRIQVVKTRLGKGTQP